MEKRIEFRIESVKTMILFKARAGFLSVQVRKAYLLLHFQLKREVDEFPIHKVQDFGNGRFNHFLYIEAPEDVDKQLLEWVIEAHGLVSD